MALYIEDSHAAALAQTLAERTGETVDQAVVRAILERLDRVPTEPSDNAALGALLSLGRECAALPDYDSRTADEILGYNENGAFGL